MTNHCSYRINLMRVCAVSIFALLVTLVFKNDAQMQGASKPIKKDKMLEVLHKNLLPTKIFVEQIEQRGVDFQVTSPVEAELKQAGARPELIAAARANYRPAAAAPVAENTSVPTNTSRNKGNNSTISGPPLTSDELIAMLQSGVPSARLEKIVEGRGVSFTLNPDVAKSITAAGGNRSLIGAIGENYKAAPDSILATNPKLPVLSYEELVDQATTSLDRNDMNTAVDLLQNAVKLDPNKPMAYAFLGWAALYGAGNPGAAEPFMREAIERGGAAIFRASHDHDGFFRDTCTGSLFITKTDVTFKADDGMHTFDAADANIKEVKLNRLVGVEFGSFHIKVGEKNYNFAPATKRRVESSMIINLVSSFK